MCGIVGVIARNKEEFRSVETMLSSIRHRGPNSSGEFHEDAVNLGHVRLSILDTSAAGSQPMVSHCGRYVIVYNGEVYNYKDLILQYQISQLNSGTDTEVVLRLFAKLGADSFRLLNGMFAFALFDRTEKKVYLVRDRLGIKPFYCYSDDNGLIFSSEMKAILSNQSVPRVCSLEGFHEWLYYGVPLGTKTMFEGIQQVPCGSYIEVCVGSMSCKNIVYWQPESVSKNFHDSKLLPESLIEQLRNAVHRQLVSDVPIGVFLSGGIDSSAIVALASERLGSKLETFAAGFEYAHTNNELPQARKVAACFGARHHEFFIRGYDVPSIVSKMVLHHDQPFSDAANIPLFLMAEEVAKRGIRVILQGDGGDEVFGGYLRYKTLHYRNLLQLLSRIWGVGHFLVPNGCRKQRIDRYLHIFGEEDVGLLFSKLLTQDDARFSLYSLLNSESQMKLSEGNPFAIYLDLGKGEDSILNKMFLADLKVTLPNLFLEKVDRSTMAASVEARVPLLDFELVDFLLSLDSTQKVKNGVPKAVFKQALSKILPNWILSPRKKGFGVPYGEWLKSDLVELFQSELSDYCHRGHQVFSRDKILAVHAQHKKGERDHSFILWKLLNFFIWVNRYKVVLPC